MLNKERKEWCRKREKKLLKNNNKNEKSTHKSKTKRKNGNRNTRVHVVELCEKVVFTS